MEIYHTIYKGGNGEIVEKKSRFIAEVHPVTSEEEAMEILEQTRKQYWDARHHCWAYIIGRNPAAERMSDDGEPAGTAGKPILEVIRGRELTNVLVIVTRYFGGILLGTGGLVRCYSGACIGAMENSDFFEIEPGIEMIVTLDYTDFQSVQYYFGKNNIKILNSKYENDIECLTEMNILTKDKFLADVKNRIINIKKVEIGKSKYVKIYQK